MVERPRRFVITPGSSLKGATTVATSIRPLHPAFAGEVSGLDSTKPIDRADVAAIDAGMDAYAVLVFRDEHVTDEQQIAFTLSFVELEQSKSPGHIRKREDHRLGQASRISRTWTATATSCRPRIAAGFSSEAIGFVAPRPALRPPRSSRWAPDHARRPPPDGDPGWVA
jgi:hypothetical protein